MGGGVVKRGHPVAAYAINFWKFSGGNVSMHICVQEAEHGCVAQVWAYALILLAFRP